MSQAQLPSDDCIFQPVHSTTCVLHEHCLPATKRDGSRTLTLQIGTRKLPITKCCAYRFHNLYAEVFSQRLMSYNCLNA